MAATRVEDGEDEVEVVRAVVVEEDGSNMDRMEAHDLLVVAPGVDEDNGQREDEDEDEVEEEEEAEMKTTWMRIRMMLMITCH